MKTDQQIKDAFKLTVDEKDSVIKIIFLSESTEYDESKRQTELVEEALMAVLNKDAQKKYSVIVDILELGEGAGDISAKPMKEGYARMASQKQVNKIAVVFVGNVILEVMANMVVRSVGKGGNIKFFKSREEALIWARN